MSEAFMPYCTLKFMDWTSGVVWFEVMLELCSEATTDEDGRVYYPGRLASPSGEGLLTAWAHEVRAYRLAADPCEGVPRYIEMRIRVLRSGDGIPPQTISGAVFRGRANTLIIEQHPQVPGPATVSTPVARPIPGDYSLRNILLFLPRHASKPTDDTLDRGEMDYLGRLRIRAVDTDHLPKDPRYLFLNAEAGLVLRYNPTLDQFYAWRFLADVFFGPAASHDALSPGLWLDIEPRSKLCPRILSGREDDATRFAGDYEFLYRRFADRIDQGKRCFFTRESASEFLIYLLALAISEPDLTVRDLLPGVTLSANQERPAFADGD